jgi:hypothetical protein
MSRQSSPFATPVLRNWEAALASEKDVAGVTSTLDRTAISPVGNGGGVDQLAGITYGESVSCCGGRCESSSSVWC